VRQAIDRYHNTDSLLPRDHGQPFKLTDNK
jgi:hypothetical protein